METSSFADVSFFAAARQMMMLPDRFFGCVAWPLSAVVGLPARPPARLLAV